MVGLGASVTEAHLFSTQLSLRLHQMIHSPKHVQPSHWAPVAPSKDDSKQSLGSSFRRLVVLLAMAAVFFVSVVLLEAALSTEGTFSETVRSVLSGLMPWLRAAAVWLAGGALLLIVALALLVRQLPKNSGL